MTQSNTINAARRLAEDFAHEITSNPAELQNWRPLEQTDEIPEQDFLMIRKLANSDDELSAAETEYRNVFNGTLNNTKTD